MQPGYLKGHSQGEYVFDHAFADAYARAGGRYYPKMLSAVPFTPATGPRLIGSPEARERLLAAVGPEGRRAVRRLQLRGELPPTRPTAPS